MILDQTEFDGGQPPGCAQDLGRDGYFSDIMENSCHSQSLDLIRTQTQFGTHGPCQIGHPPLVSGRIGVLGFDNGGNGLNSAAQGFAQTVHAFLFFGNVFYDALQVGLVVLFVADNSHGAGYPDFPPVISVKLNFLPSDNSFPLHLFNDFCPFFGIHVNPPGKVGLFVKQFLRRVVSQYSRHGLIGHQESSFTCGLIDSLLGVFEDVAVSLFRTLQAQLRLLALRHIPGKTAKANRLTAGIPDHSPRNLIESLCLVFSDDFNFQGLERLARFVRRFINLRGPFQTFAVQITPGIHTAHFLSGVAYNVAFRVIDECVVSSKIDFKITIFHLFDNGAVLFLACAKILLSLSTVGNVRNETQGGRHAVPGNYPGVDLQPFDGSVRGNDPKLIIIFRDFTFQSHPVPV
ncbi:MAG: hypothetical protein BWY42_01742 [Candidatus Omnitrophica bacterium ADurb.Bin277]|nr:MAG: hypothetical protein BWY42_01742 [Candidatus Omnitrophica bacterium ADurb.Bin277]